MMEGLEADFAGAPRGVLAKFGSHHENRIPSSKLMWMVDDVPLFSSSSCFSRREIGELPFVSARGLLLPHPIANPSKSWELAHSRPL